jgi:hypothetical protein
MWVKEMVTYDLIFVLFLFCVVLYLAPLLELDPIYLTLRDVTVRISLFHQEWTNPRHSQRRAYDTEQKQNKN